MINLIYMNDFGEETFEKTVDTLILAASVDERSYIAYESLKSQGVSIKNIIVFDYKKFRPSGDTNHQNTYYKLRGEKGVTFVSCENDEEDGIALSQLKIDDISNVFFDITSICIPDIFKICFVLKECQNISSLNVIYSEPKYYSHLKDVYFTYDSCLVEREYKPLNEFFTSSVSMETVLVCFLGFDRLVSKYVHERQEHFDVIPINGFPGYYPKLKDISLERNYELISTIGCKSIQYTQANDPFRAYNILSKIKSKNAGKLLEICVLGSKPMALGACVFALHNPDCTKISYPFPKEYVVNTTIDFSKTWLYKIKLVN